MSQATTAPKSNATAHWQALDAAHHLHAFSDHANLAAKGARVITRAEGIYLWDSEGERILDGMAGLWCVQVGYGREELALAGYEALKELPYYNIFFQTTHPYVAELSAAIAAKLPEGMDRIFFANSGSEANDSAVKMIRYFWNLQNKPNKKQIISRHRGYHGVTMAAASLSGLTPMHPQADLPLPGFHHVMEPATFDHPDKTPEEVGALAAQSLEDKILELGPDNVAAFIGEPVMGAGGLIIPPPGYWDAVQKICRKYDVLLHADEVICGFGRTGNWFGSDTYTIEPDILTIAKGMSSGYQPISGVAVGERVGKALFEADEEWSHGFTYSGHPVACAVALKNLEIIERENLVGKTGGETGDYFQSKLNELADHPIVGETRGIGLLGAIELVADKETRARFDDPRGAGTVCRDHCFSNGLIMRAIGDTMVLSPPLVISKNEIDELFGLARKSLDMAARDLAS